MTGLTASRNSAPMIGYYFFTDRQPNARTGKLVFAVQPLKHLKDAVQVLFLEAKAVVNDIGVPLKKVHKPRSAVAVTTRAGASHQTDRTFS